MMREWRSIDAFDLKQGVGGSYQGTRDFPPKARLTWDAILDLSIGMRSDFTFHELCGRNGPPGKAACPSHSIASPTASSDTIVQ